MYLVTRGSKACAYPHNAYCGADIKGDVFNLTELKDIEGNYKAFQSSGAFADGPTKFWELKTDSNETARLIDAEVKSLVDEGRERAFRTL